MERTPPQSRKLEVEDKYPSLRKWVDRLIGLFCLEFKIDGDPEKIRKLVEQGNNPVIVSSHFSNLDAPAAVKAFEGFQLQITRESLHFQDPLQKLTFSLAGRMNFSPLTYKEKGRPVFNPDDFNNLISVLRDNGRIPWFAIHPFTTEGKMKKASIGPIYLAHKLEGIIVPVALELSGGGSISLEGPKEWWKGLKRKAKAVYHIGSPMELQPIEGLDIVEIVLNKRMAGEKISKEELEDFRLVISQLREQANSVALKIASMLPENQRGGYTK